MTLLVFVFFSSFWKYKSTMNELEAQLLQEIVSYTPEGIINNVCSSIRFCRDTLKIDNKDTIAELTLSAVYNKYFRAPSPEIRPISLQALEALSEMTTRPLVDELLSESKNGEARACACAIS